MSTVRLRRLNADFETLSDYVHRHPRLRLVQTSGEPPERYQLEYRIKSLKKKDDELTSVKKHLVEIALPRNYPRTPPQCRMLTPVFHPNIAPHAICVGDHWSAGESLESIVIRIGEMLAYQIYNVKSPLNGEAARWVQEHEDQLPLDEVSLLAEDPEPDDVEWVPDNEPTNQSETEMSSEASLESTVPPRVEVPTKTVSDQIVAICEHCSKKYRVPANLVGRSANCKNCGHAFVICMSDG